MNPIRISADMLHFFSLLILLLKIYSTKNCRGISLKTQFLYALVFLMRYLDLFWNFDSLYNSVMKVIFISITLLIVYLMKYREPYCNSYEANSDNFPIIYLIFFALAIGLAINVGEVYLYDDFFYISEVFWTSSIYLEAVAIVPQLFVVREFAKDNRGFVENLTSHYVFALGGYRALYMINWIYRYYTEVYYMSWIVWIGGTLQTVSFFFFFFCIIYNLHILCKTLYTQASIVFPIDHKISDLLGSIRGKILIFL